ncbi:MAG: hypothetical protein K9L68_14070 [Spirochaetales bacterium]|nr:hypothetical protein [Spirochaetales bacterium]MCF7939720.1 hypothetical protein [Spirochaetales bacterium]
MKVNTKNIKGQESYLLENKTIQLAVTKTGGQMAPVTFYRDTKKPVEPYFIAPWAEENLKLDEPVVGILRGDFFCMPFGAPSSGKGYSFTTHGEPSFTAWTGASIQKEGKVSTLTASNQTKNKPAKISKQISIVEGQNVVYSRHLISGFTGSMPLGHHPTLKLPEKEGIVTVKTSPTQFCFVNPGNANPVSGKEYGSAQAGATFTALNRVPSIWKKPANLDFSTLPHSAGFDDILQFVLKPQKQPAWAMVVNSAERFLWFSLQDTDILPSIIMWAEQQGRHQTPWSGRTRCLGIESVSAYGSSGYKVSTGKNWLKEKGFPTALKLNAKKETSVNFIQGVARIPAGFKAVKSVRFEKNEIQVTSKSGKKVKIPVYHNFVKTGEIAPA